MQFKIDKKTGLKQTQPSSSKAKDDPQHSQSHVYKKLSDTLDSQGIMSGHDPNKVSLSHTGSHLI